MVSAAFVALALLLALAVFAAVLWPLRRQSRGLALSLGGAGMALVAAALVANGESPLRRTCLPAILV